MGLVESFEFLDLTLDLQERGVHARVLGMAEEDCAGLIVPSRYHDDLDIKFHDFCRFGWEIEDAFRSAGLNDCIVSGGGIIVVRSEKLDL